MSTDISAILEFAGSETAGRRMDEVQDHELPPVLLDLIEEYETFEGARDIFLWRWVHQLAPQFTLPSVRPEYKDHVRTDKTIATLFITLLDDLLEDLKDQETFEEAAKIPFPSQAIDWDRDDIDADYVAFTQHVWETLEGRLRDAPEYETYERTLRYDLKQAINAVEYSFLVIQRPKVTTLHELTTYQSHNMMLFPYANIDLMHSPPIEHEAIPELREAIWCAQRMARIGNWVSTWERELTEGDYSSGVLVYAIRNDVFTEAEREAMDAGDVRLRDDVSERIHRHGIEEMFLERWDERYRELVEISERIDAMDLTPYVEGMREVLRYHLASRGMK